MRREQFNRAIAVLVKAFPDKEFDIDVLWCFLQDLHPRQLEKAIVKIVASTVEINRSTNITALIRQHVFDEDLTAGEAWGEVLAEISRTGSYGTPRFSSPIIKKAVDCIGWQSMCLSENISVERAHFFRVFENLVRKDHQNRILPKGIPALEIDKLTFTKGAL